MKGLDFFDHINFININPLIRRVFWTLLTAVFFVFFYRIIPENYPSLCNFVTTIIAAALCTVLTIQSIINLPNIKSVNQLHKKDWRVFIFSILPFFLLIVFGFDLSINGVNSIQKLIKENSEITICTCDIDNLKNAYCKFKVNGNSRQFVSDKIYKEKLDNLMPNNKLYISYLNDNPSINKLLFDVQDLKRYTRLPSFELTFEGIIKHAELSDSEQLRFLNENYIGWFYNELKQEWQNKILNLTIDNRNSEKIVIQAKSVFDSFESIFKKELELNNIHANRVIKFNGWDLKSSFTLIGDSFGLVYTLKKIKSG